MKALARPAALPAAFATALLALLAVGGVLVRPAADDWCYQANMRTMSVGRFVGFLYQDSNGRAGNAVLLAWVHGLGPLGLRLYPVVVITVMLGSLWLLIARLVRLTGHAVPVAAQLLTAATVSLAFLLVCPQPYQTTYWASGGISHTVPAVLGTALVAGVLCLPGRTGRAGLAGRWTAAAVLVPGFAFIALVSEATALMVGVLAAVLWLRAGDLCADRPGRGAARLGAVASAAGAAGGLLIEYASPGMHSRSTVLGVPHGTELLTRLGDGALTWAGELATTLTSWDYAAVLLAGALLGLSLHRRTPTPALRSARQSREAAIAPAAARTAALAHRAGTEAGPAGAPAQSVAVPPARSAADAGHGGVATTTAEAAWAHATRGQSVAVPLARSAAEADHGGVATTTAEAATAHQPAPAPAPAERGPSSEPAAGELAAVLGRSVDAPAASSATGADRQGDATASAGADQAGAGRPWAAGARQPAEPAAGGAGEGGSARPAAGGAGEGSSAHPAAGGAGESGSARPAAGGFAPALAVRSPLRLLLWSAVGVLVGSLLVTELVQVVFGPRVWEMVRTWNDWRLPYTLLLAAIGVAVGRLLAGAVAPVPGGARERRARLVLPSLMGLALLGLSQPAVAVVHQTAVRAQHWDAQERALRAQFRAGVRDPAYVASFIGGMRDAYTRSGRPDWVAACVDDYYGTHIRLPAHSADWIDQSRNAPVP